MKKEKDNLDADDWEKKELEKLRKKEKGDDVDVVPHPEWPPRRGGRIITTRDIPAVDLTKIKDQRPEEEDS